MGWCSSCVSKRKWDLWDSFVGKEEIYMRDDLHLSGKGGGCRFCRGTIRGGCQWFG